MIEFVIAGFGLLLFLVIIFLPAFKVAPFAYGASRLRAARARFLSRRELNNLAYSGYYDTLVAIDERMDLHLSKLVSEKFPEEKVQRRIREYRIKCMNNIVNYTPERYKPFFKVLLGKETLEFIIAAIRSKLNPTFNKRVLESMFTDARFSVERFSEMNLDELLTELEKTPYGKDIIKFRDQILAGELEDFEEALNTDYYARLVKAANHVILQKCAKRIIDIHNVKQGLCLAPFKTIKGGSLSASVCDQLVQATTVEQVKTALQETYFAPHIQGKETITELYQGMYRSFNAYANELASQQPLSLNQMVAYYINNIIEIKNIRILLKLEHAKVEPKEIEEAFI